MRGNGATTPASNGGSQRHVTESQGFRDRCAELEPAAPRLREILRGVRRQLAHNAESGARNLGMGGPSWVRETPFGLGAPRLWIYYVISPGEACLQWVDLAEEEYPGADDDIPF